MHEEERVRREMRQRAGLIYWWKWHYYNTQPLISDEKFDLRTVELMELEQDNPGLITYHSPNDMVGPPNYPTLDDLKVAMRLTFGLEF